MEIDCSQIVTITKIVIDEGGLQFNKQSQKRLKVTGLEELKYPLSSLNKKEKEILLKSFEYIDTFYFSHQLRYWVTWLDHLLYGIEASEW